MYYSLLNREFEWEPMPLGVDQQVGTFVWSPLEQQDVWEDVIVVTIRFRKMKSARGGAPVGDEIMSYDLLYNII